MVIDFTAQLAPIAVGLVVALVLAAAGIVSCVDEREVPVLSHWLQASRETLVVSLRRVLSVGRSVGRLPSVPRG